jgi:tRNA-specific 2-thiouridylase
MKLTAGLPGVPTQSDSDVLAARDTCARLGIEHRVVDFSDAFRKHVVDDFVEVYKRGKTPNPCIVCNKNIKFGALLDYALQNGCTGIASGHYARIERDPSGRFLLKTAADSSKDQSYMLWMLSQDQLSRCIFPLGSLTKPEVRELACGLAFENASQKDSQDVCFIPDGDYARFISHYADVSKTGNYVDMQGNVLGKHKGIIHYTVGQRKGLGIALGQPMFVHSKSAETGNVVLCKNEELFSKTLTASNVNLIACDSIDSPIRVTAKTRYHQSPASATVIQIAPDKIRVDFDEPVRAISPGQSVVIYDGDVVIGGGFID